MGGKGSGRKPQPLALKVFRGGRVQNLRTPAEIDAPDMAELPPAPEFLNEVGRAMWESDGENLRVIGVLSDVDASDFGVVCYAWQRMRQLIAEAQGPSTVMDDKGAEKTAPALAELRRWIPLVRSMRSDYGLSGPRSRMLPSDESELQSASSPLQQFKASMGGHVG